MSQRIIKSVLWKKVMEATIDTLTGKSTGQYHIELGRGSGVEAFFDCCNQGNQNATGGFEIDLPIERVDCNPAVASETLPIKFLGANSARKTWIMSSQRPTTAYPLWREARAFPNGVVGDNYILILRDNDDLFHARWLNASDISSLPAQLSKLIQSKDFDVTYNLSSTASPKAKEIIRAIKDKTNVLLYGPPATGKTHIMKEVLAKFEEGDLLLDSTKDIGFISHNCLNKTPKSEFITFHQSYSYENFVIGLRPDTQSAKLLSLVPSVGVLVKLSEFTRVTKNPSILIIDEINRGNVSKIFGEFITLMEPNKRLKKDGTYSSTTVGINLPCLRDGETVKFDVDGTALSLTNPFSVPKELFTLASMNSVDKSIAPLDAALRRRFHIINLEPDLKELKLAFDEHKSNDSRIEDIKDLSIRLLKYLNKQIAFFRGKDFQLGHWYFSELCGEQNELSLTETIFSELWYHKVFPQLEELFHGRDEQLIRILDATLRGATITEFPFEIVSPEVDLEQYGASAYLQIKTISSADLFTYLTALAQTN
jgi:5-methylcytosine-specific restriction protein B